MATKNATGRGERSSALWGTTRRDGDSKGSALWGNGPGRFRGPDRSSRPDVPWAAAGEASTLWVSGSGSARLCRSGRTARGSARQPGQTFRVIVQGSAGRTPARRPSGRAEPRRPTRGWPLRRPGRGRRKEGARTLRGSPRAKATQVAEAKADAARRSRRQPRVASRATTRQRETRRRNHKAAERPRRGRDAAAAKAAAGATTDAVAAAEPTFAARGPDPQRQISRRFPSIAGVAAGLTGEQVSGLASGGNEGLLSITPDTAVELTAASSGRRIRTGRTRAVPRTTGRWIGRTSNQDARDRDRRLWDRGPGGLRRSCAAAVPAAVARGVVRQRAEVDRGDDPSVEVGARLDTRVDDRDRRHVGAHVRSRSSLAQLTSAPVARGHS